MNRYLNMLTLAAALLFAGCEMLEVEPKSTIKEETYYNNADEAQTALFGIYAAFAEDAMFGYTLSITFPKMSDESVHTSTTVDNGRSGLMNFGGVGGIISAANTEIDDPFICLYKAIGRANAVVEHIRQMPQLHDADAEGIAVRQCLGEALTLRAIAYFELIKNWGDVPFLEEAVDINRPALDYRLPRTSRDTIYDHIIADVQYAADSLLQPRSRVGVQERVCRDAARGILARLALHAAGYSLRWDLAADDGKTTGLACRMARRADAERIEELYRIALRETDRVIASGEHRLNPSYERVFRSTMEFKDDETYENMFAIGFTRANNAGGGRIGAANSPGQDEKCKWSKGNREVYAMPSCFICYEPCTKEKPMMDAAGNIIWRDNNGQQVKLESGLYSNDLRRDVAICRYSIDTGSYFQLQNSTRYCAGKWRRHWAPPESNTDVDRTSINWVMLRYADVLLMNAEASWHFGNMDEAKRKLNMVRRRGYGHPVNDGSGSDVLGADIPDGVWRKTVLEAPAADNLSYAIVRERMLELCFEGLRKYDLIRWNIYGVYMNKACTDLTDFAIANPANTGVSNTYPYASDYSINMATNAMLYFNRIHCTTKFATSAEQFFSCVLDGDYQTSTTEVRGLFAEGAAGVATNFQYFTADKNELYPVPQSEMDANPNLWQCPAYR